MKRLMIWLGIAISFGFLAVLLARMDGDIFVTAMSGVQVKWLAGAFLFSVVGLALRSLRWNVLSGRPLEQVSHFFRSAAIGQLGNYIYPLRAGDVLRMITLNQFAKVPIGQAVTSAVVDRICDGVLLVIFLLVALVLHSVEVIGVNAIVLVIGIFGLLTLGSIVFVIYGRRAQHRVTKWCENLPGQWADRAISSYEGAVHVADAFRSPRRLIGMLVISSLIALSDFSMAWALIYTMGWNLPFAAAITAVVFMWAGSALPSAPGFIGVYQVACVLAFALYGIDESAAIAYSIVLQLVSLCTAALLGGSAAMSYGFNLRSGLAKAQEIDLAKLEEGSTT